MKDWQETGYIEVKEGFCISNACGNGYYLTACGELIKMSKYEHENAKTCLKCGKPIWRE